MDALGEARVLVEALAPVIKQHVSASTAPLFARMIAMEERFETLQRGRDGRDGRDADPETVAAAVADAMAKQPPPTPGRDGRDGTDGSSVTLDEVLAALPPPERGEAGPPGADGKSVALEDILPALERAVAEEFAKVPVPRDGRDGQDADPALVAEMVAAGVDNAVRALPASERGPIGEQGPAGSVDMDVIAEMVSAAVVKHVALLPPGEQGPAGAPGRDGVDGMDGENGERGEPGRDGIGIVSAIIGRDGNLQLSFTDGHLLDVGPVVGRDGAPGLHGADGTDGMAGSAGERGADGTPGPAGVGLVDAVVRDGSLVLSLSDGKSIELGYIAGKDGEPGRAGADADMAAIEARIETRLAEVAAALPLPERGPEGPAGRDGRDGADADEALLHVKLVEAVTTAVAELPPAERGPEGPVGQPGRDGVDGANVDLEAVVTRAMAAIPPPERGEPGPQGERGAPGERGHSGIGLASALIDRNGGLVVTLTDGSTKELGRVVGADADMDALAKTVVDEIGKIPRPRDGRDGVDGVGFDSLEVIQTDERHAAIRFTKGERVREFAITLPGMLDRGVWKDGEKYLRGDVVTWGGSAFVAQKDNPDGKPEVSQDFRLAIKRGRDGKDGKDGRPGERGPDGRPGRDGGTY